MCHGGCWPSYRSGREKGTGALVVSAVTPVGQSATVFSLLHACLAARTLGRLVFDEAPDPSGVMMAAAVKRWKRSVEQLLSDIRPANDPRFSKGFWNQGSGVAIGEWIQADRLGVVLSPYASSMPGTETVAVTTPVGYCPDPHTCVSVLSRCESGIFHAPRTPQLTWEHLFGHAFYVDAPELTMPTLDDQPWAAYRLGSARP